MRKSLDGVLRGVINGRLARSGIWHIFDLLSAFASRTMDVPGGLQDKRTTHCECGFPDQDDDPHSGRRTSLIGLRLSSVRFHDRLRRYGSRGLFRKVMVRRP